MSRNTYPILPSNQRILVQMGENIRLARLRRKLSAAQIAERAGISRPTLSSLENGSSSPSIGTLVQVLFVLGLEKDLVSLARDDVLGRKIQDAGLIIKRRAPKKDNKL